MKFLFKTLGATAVLMALQIVPANASILDFAATLSGANETPPNSSTATGSILVTLDDVLDTLTVSESFSGLSAPASAAHIHCCQPAGTAAGVVLPFGAAAGFPVGSTSGSFTHTFDLTTSLVGISVANFIAGLESGLAYANIHDVNFPPGEIRGQLVRVPEPATLLMFGLGAGLLGFARRRRTH